MFVGGHPIIIAVSTAAASGPSVWLFVGGVLGGALRVLLLGKRLTWRRRHLFDMVMGGALAVILPTITPLLGVSLPATWDRLTYAAAGFVIGGFGNYLIVALLWKFGVFKADARADKPNGNGGTV